MSPDEVGEDVELQAITCASLGRSKSFGISFERYLVNSKIQIIQIIRKFSKIKYLPIDRHSLGMALFLAAI